MKIIIKTDKNKKPYPEIEKNNYKLKRNEVLLFENLTINKAKRKLTEWYIEKEQGLKPFTMDYIQVCKRCGAFDVGKGDGHKCNAEYQEERRESILRGDN